MNLLFSLPALVGLCGVAAFALVLLVTILVTPPES